MVQPDDDGVGAVQLNDTIQDRTACRNTSLLLQNPDEVQTQIIDLSLHTILLDYVLIEQAVNGNLSEENPRLNVE